MKLLLGDCLDKLKELKDNSVDSVVTDPPYGLSAAPNSGKKSKGGFMGKKWDYDVPSQEIWEECIRVLKPGGHLLAFAGSRTYHRMAVRIEDAGFEIRDQILWVYGSGFPKSMNIGKGVDKKLGNEREVVGQKKYSPGWHKDHLVNDDNWVGSDDKGLNITKGNSEWEGWGTHLKPAHEPIVMARKPLSEKTVVDNVLEWGTGGINIDESRIPYQNDNDRSGWHKTGADGSKGYQDEETFKIRPISAEEIKERTASGRFPANIIFDEEAGKLLDEQSGLNRGQQRVVKGDEPSHSKKNAIYGDYSMVPGKYMEPKDGLGGASRFFYCPKTSKTDRNEGLAEFEDKQRPGQTVKGNYSSSPVCKDCGKTINGTNNHSNCKEGLEYRPSTTTTKNNHPTVKPTDLMLYLIRLVTPKGGTTLDPFMGSGSTGKAAVRGGFDFIGIEMEREYFKIAEARIQYEVDNPYVEVKSKRVNVNKNSNKFF